MRTQTSRFPTWLIVTLITLGATALVACIGFAGWAITGANVPDRPSSGNIVDQADIYTDAQERSLNQLIDGRAANNHPDIKVITYNEDRGNPLKYATKIGNRWDVGGKDDYGIVIAIDTSQQETGIAVAKGAESQVSDDEAERIARDVLQPAFGTKSYSSATSRALTSIYAETAKPGEAKEKSFWEKLKGILTALAFVAMVLALVTWGVRGLYRAIFGRAIKARILRKADQEVDEFQRNHPGVDVRMVEREVYKNYRVAMRYNKRWRRYNKKIAKAEAKDRIPYTYFYPDFEGWYPMYLKFPMHYAGSLIIPQSMKNSGSSDVGYIGSSGSSGGFGGGGGFSD